jgi:arylformamidase
MKILDISLPIRKGMAVYPNNPGVKIELKRTKYSFLSKITFGSHTGTHLDAPRHVSKNGIGVDRVAVGKLVGPCRVLDMTRVKSAITIDDLKRHRVRRGERILVKTRNSIRGFRKFYADYVYLDGDAARFLAQKGIALFGTDYLSVKQRGSSDNRPHTELLGRGIPIFEGLDFSGVRPGSYEFIGLPLRLVGLDGAPARAILIRRGK